MNEKKQKIVQIIFKYAISTKINKQLNVQTYHNPNPYTRRCCFQSVLALKQTVKTVLP